MGEELIELKFRIYDGTDIAHSTYASSMTVANLKLKIVVGWPRGYKSISVFMFPPLKLLLAELYNWINI
ncbi:Membrane-anchored ubiquitin-fold protein 5 [Hibiscus syriacus]|uniref:Membrane-anchored ubiquitin-fold protein 5 n=1 Tax=Hibiscus syriacus TaxID=106335 RepID=A0A6A2YJS9_HIBSY|nr:Membrane-anchored ubiquitin-fold protein 5 [Hibiscus syriacus]